MNLHSTFEAAPKDIVQSALIFAWGPLTNVAKRLEVFGEPLMAREATLSNWSRFHCADGRAVIRPSLGDSVDGVIISVDANHILAVDAHCAMVGLERLVTMLELDGARLWTYIYTRKSGDLSKPTYH